MTIHKYKLPYHPGFVEIGPVGAYEVLHVGVQDNLPYIWVGFESSDYSINNSSLAILCLYTGQDIPKGAAHIGSVVLESNGLVLHYFRP